MKKKRIKIDESEYEDNDVVVKDSINFDNVFHKNAQKIVLKKSFEVKNENEFFETEVGKKKK